MRRSKSEEKMRSLAFRTLSAVLGTAAIFGAAVYAQDSTAGKLKIRVSPSEAYTFVDGQGEDPGSRTIKLLAGTHKVLVATYGYRFIEKEFTISPGQDTALDVSLEREGGVVFGPKGRIQIEPGLYLDAGDDAVLLNGKSPYYFVGHVDEFNNELFFHQELVVPPGNHLVTVTHHGKEVWSGMVPVAENQRVILTLRDGKMVTKDWPRGAQLGSLPRFKSGAFSTTVGVAPVSSSVSANPARIDCGQSSHLNWASVDTIDADMSHMSPVPTTGARSVSPKETTTYELTATGPGGVTKSSATVEVNQSVQSSLTASPAEVRYRRIGDKVKEPANVTLNWTSANADRVSLAPFGPVDLNGDRSLVVALSQAAEGPVDETVNYTLTASNACGGTETKVVPVHVTGSIEPVPDVLLHSVFYPTDYPSKSSARLGLVRSQQDALTTLAAGFVKYLEYDADAKLNLSGYADDRGADKYNQFLSERRVQRVKEFLIARGVPENKIETVAYGKEKPIAKTTVIELQQKNPAQPPDTFMRNFTATWLAHNRRVDVTLIPTNAESLRFYPNQAPDSTILWQRAKPTLELIEKNQ
jgi:hypothetical protein